MASTPDLSPLPAEAAAWLRKQPAAVRKALTAAIDFTTGTVRDAAIGAPTEGAVDVMRMMAHAGTQLPNAAYFHLAHDLYDKAGALALWLGISHCPTEKLLHGFLSLAGTTLMSDPLAISRFEATFSPEASLDAVVDYLQGELEMMGGGFPGE